MRVYFVRRASVCWSTKRLRGRVCWKGWFWLALCRQYPPSDTTVILSLPLASSLSRSLPLSLYPSALFPSPRPSPTIPSSPIGFAFSAANAAATLYTDCFVSDEQWTYTTDSAPPPTLPAPTASTVIIAAARIVMASIQLASSVSRPTRDKGEIRWYTDKY